MLTNHEALEDGVEQPDRAISLVAQLEPIATPTPAIPGRR